MDRFTPRLTPLAALQLNEHYVEAHPADKVALDQRLREPKCQVEFVLDPTDSTGRRGKRKSR